FPCADGIGVNVWHAAQPFARNTCSPAAAPPPPPPLGGGGGAGLLAFSRHVSKSACVITTTLLRISAGPRPHHSLQITGNEPVRVGVITSVGSMPGTASCFCPNSGTQNEWMTSFACRYSLTLRSTGRRMIGNEVLPLS